MKLSIVIPSFNGQRSLSNSLSTLLNQTAKPHEIIVVDDGSDEKLTVPSGVRLIRIQRDPVYRGSSEAKNIGASASTGDWLAFTDNDILHMPDAVECVTNRVHLTKSDNILASVFSLTVPDGLLEICNWIPGERGSMETLLACFRNQGKLFSGSKQDGVEASANSGLVTGLFTDSDETFLISSEQHFGVISKHFFNTIGGYDSATFKSWGLNNQDLCLRVIKHGGRIVSNIFRKDGELLHCFHQYGNSEHDSITAKAEFFGKYQQNYSPHMLIGAQH